MDNRRQFMRLFGATTAVTVAPSGEREILREPTARKEFVQTQAIEKRFCDQFRVYSQTLYSRFQVNRNAMPLSFHCFGVSPSYDVAETNMQSNNMLTAPSAFLIKAIGVTFSPATIPEYRSAFCERYRFQLMIGNLYFGQYPLSTLFGDTADAPKFTPYTSLLPLEEPYPLIESNQYFKVIIEGTPIQPCGKLTGWALLRGLMGSPKM